MAKLLTLDEAVALSAAGRDGLILLARGLGVHRVLLAVLRDYFGRHSGADKRLVLVLNGTQAGSALLLEQARLLDLFCEQPAPFRRASSHRQEEDCEEEDSAVASLLPSTQLDAAARARVFPLSSTRTQNLSNLSKNLSKQTTGPARIPLIDCFGLSGDEREVLYARGGVLLLSNRTAVTDLLTGRLPPDLLHGIFVERCESLSRSANAAHALEIFRQQTRQGFITGLSDRPELLAGVALERTMKLLFTSNLFLFPRFHPDVTSCLDAVEAAPQCDVSSVLLSVAATDVQKNVCLLLKMGLDKLKKNR